MLAIPNTRFFYFRSNLLPLILRPMPESISQIPILRPYMIRGTLSPGTALHHGLVLLRKALSEALTRLEELVDAARHARLLLVRDGLGREVVNAVVEASSSEGG